MSEKSNDTTCDATLEACAAFVESVGLRGIADAVRTMGRPIADPWRIVEVYVSEHGESTRTVVEPPLPPLPRAAAEDVAQFLGEPSTNGHGSIRYEAEPNCGWRDYREAPAPVMPLPGREEPAHHPHVDRRGAGGRTAAIVAGHSVLCAEFGTDAACPGPAEPRRETPAEAADLAALLWEERGPIDVCRACGFVREGTAAAAIQHQGRCSAARLYAAACTALREATDRAERAERGRDHSNRTAAEWEETARHNFRRAEQADRDLDAARAELAATLAPVEVPDAGVFAVRLARESLAETEGTGNEPVPFEVIGWVALARDDEYARAAAHLRAKLAQVERLARAVCAVGWTHGEECPHRYCEQTECVGDEDNCQAEGHPCSCVVARVVALRKAAESASAKLTTVIDRHFDGGGRVVTEIGEVERDLRLATGQGTREPDPAAILGPAAPQPPLPCLAKGCDAPRFGDLDWCLACAPRCTCGEVIPRRGGMRCDACTTRRASSGEVAKKP